MRALGGDKRATAGAAGAAGVVDTACTARSYGATSSGISDSGISDSGISDSGISAIRWRRCHLCYVPVWGFARHYVTSNGALISLTASAS
jgi:hypothetical protein